MLLHLKFTLLAVFVLSTLLGLASTNLHALLIGLLALGLSLGIALVSYLWTPRTPRRELHTSF